VYKLERKGKVTKYVTKEEFERHFPPETIVRLGIRVTYVKEEPKMFILNVGGRKQKHLSHLPQKKIKKRKIEKTKKKDFEYYKKLAEENRKKQEELMKKRHEKVKRLHNIK
jgi:hypothetical protein